MSPDAINLYLHDDRLPPSLDVKERSCKKGRARNAYLERFYAVKEEVKNMTRLPIR